MIRIQVPLEVNFTIEVDMDTHEDSLVLFPSKEPFTTEDPPNEDTNPEDHEILMDLVKGQTLWQKSISHQLKKIDANMAILTASVRQLVASVNSIAAVKEPKLEE
jgi:hypothetical protein